mmetsp:Transcript_11623/g.23421  ORF Transcript_11623/g.23421 Transcript_11623/m.23421 type:complete len:206 (-) Transcript_11623:248-865(-)
MIRNDHRNKTGGDQKLVHLCLYLICYGAAFTVSRIRLLFALEVNCSPSLARELIRSIHISIHRSVCTTQLQKRPHHRKLPLTPLAQPPIPRPHRHHGHHPSLPRRPHLLFRIAHEHHLLGLRSASQRLGDSLVTGRDFLIARGGIEMGVEMGREISVGCVSKEEFLGGDGSGGVDGYADRRSGGGVLGGFGVGGRVWAAAPVEEG